MEENTVEIDFDNHKTIQFIYDYLKNSIKVTHEKWHQFIVKAKYKTKITKFLTEKSLSNLVFYTNKTGSVHVSEYFPLNFHSKACFFIKRTKYALISNIFDPKSQIFFGSISSNALYQFDSFLNNYDSFFLNNNEDKTANSIQIFNELKFYLKFIRSLIYSFSSMSNNFNNQSIFLLLLDSISFFNSKTEENLKNR